MRHIRFEWNFFGEDGKGTAEHHVRHLKEFMHRERFEAIQYDVKPVDELIWSAMMVIDEPTAHQIKTALKPNRAFIHQS